MSQTIYYRFVVKRDTAAAFTAANTLLLSGEWALETDTLKFKIGDGVTPWNSLGYVTSDRIPEGAANLYFTDERAQDAIGAAIAAGTGDGASLSYDDAGNAIGVVNTDKGTAAVSNHVALADPHPQYLMPAEGDAAYAPITHVGAGGAAHALAVAAGADGFMSGADKAKLDGVAAGATANSTDAQLRDRATHTGTQLASTISDFAAAAQFSVVVATITDADTSHAPSSDAVFDALALKTSNASAAITGGTINGASVGATTRSSGAFTTLNSSDASVIGGLPVGLGPGLGASNVAIGSEALASRTTANSQVAIGYRALWKNQTQDSNVAIGSLAFGLLTTGLGNIAIGKEAGYGGATHNNSVLIGNFCGNVASTDTAVGVGGYSINTSGGVQPVAVGYAALYALSSGQGNIGVGYNAGRYQTGGSGNIYVGWFAGATTTAANANVTGEYNTHLGYAAGPGTATQLSYTSVIGASATVTTSNTVVLGRAADATVVGATGDDGSGAKLQVTGAIKSTAHYKVGANQVVGARNTGWAAMTGTGSKATIAAAAAGTASASYVQAELQDALDRIAALEARMKAYDDALHAHGLIGA